MAGGDECDAGLKYIYIVIPAKAGILIIKNSAQQTNQNDVVPLCRVY